MAPRKKAAMNQGPVATKAVVGASLVMPGKRTIKVGSMIGQGGFGAIHLAKETKAAGSSSVTAASADLVVKIEAVDSGGLFSEMKVLANLNLATWQSQGLGAQELRCVTLCGWMERGVRGRESLCVCVKAQELRCVIVCVPLERAVGFSPCVFINSDSTVPPGDRS
eukprot:m.212032 g.212032  ORF g.212032 m.212032 type:complete len:166 (-) comp18583_c0_seq4:1293-1790(-)